MNKVTKAIRGFIIRAAGGKAPWDDYWYKPFSGPTTAGVQVDEELAMNLVTVFSCVRVISENLGSLPCNVYKRTATGKEKADTHPLYKLIHTQPNPEITAMAFRECLTAHLVTWGNGYAEKVFTPRGELVELWPIPPNRVTVYRYQGRLIYEIRLDNGEKRYLDRDRCFHVAGLGFDGVTGYSVIEKARETIGLTLAMQEFGARYFGAGTHPGVVVKHPGELSKQGFENLRTSLDTKYSGLGQAHRLMLLEEGMEIENIGIPPNDAQFLESRKFQKNDICGLFRVPPHMIGDLERATFSNIEHQSIEFVVYCLTPWLTRWEQNMNIQLLSTQERAIYYFRHVVNALLRGDTKSRYEAYAQGIQNGFLCPDDVRELEDMNPIPNGAGKKFIVQLNMQLLEDVGTVPEPPAQDPLAPAEGDQDNDTGQENQKREIIDMELTNETPPLEVRRAYVRVVMEIEKLQMQYHRLFKDAGQRLVNRECIAIRKAFKKIYGPILEGRGDQHQVTIYERDMIQVDGIMRNPPAEFTAWLDDFYKTMPENIRRTFLPLHSAFAESVANEASRMVRGKGFQDVTWVDTWSEKYLDIFAQRHMGSSLYQIRDLVRETPIAELQKALEQRLVEWEKNRAKKIADDETVRMANATARETYERCGVEKLVWVARGVKSCPFADNYQDGLLE